MRCISALCRRGTIDALYDVRQLQKYIATNKLLYFAFVDLEKAFDHVSRKVQWWASRASGSRNGLCVLSRACTSMLGVVCGSWTSTVRSLAWELVCIRALSLARCSSSWCWRRFHLNSPLVCHGSFFTLLTQFHRRHQGGVYLQVQSVEGWHGK